MSYTTHTEINGKRVSIRFVLTAFGNVVYELNTRTGSSRIEAQYLQNHGTTNTVRLPNMILRREWSWSESTGLTLDEAIQAVNEHLKQEHENYLKWRAEPRNADIIGCTEEEPLRLIVKEEQTNEHQN